MTLLLALSPTLQLGLIIFFAVVVGALLFLAIYFFFGATFQRLLTERLTARAWVAGVVALGCVLAGGVAANACFAEFSKPVDSKDSHLGLLVISLSVAVCFICSQVALSAFTEDVSEGNKRLRTALKQANTRVKDAVRELAQAKSRNAFNQLISNVFLEAVTQKHASLTKLQATAQANGNITADQLREAFDPNYRRTFLLQKLFFIFDYWLQQGNRADLRLAYFKSDGTYLRIAHCCNRKQDTECISIPATNLDRFRLVGGQSMVVDVARTGKVVVSENADLDHLDPAHPFEHFEDDGGILSRGVIKSAICFPIGSPAKGHCQHVIFVDCTVANFFQNGYLEQYNYIIDQLQRRFLYELVLENILNSLA
jgi:uncharacterized membrane protein